MQVSLTTDFFFKFHTFVPGFIQGPTRVKIRKLVALIGLMTAYAPTVLYGGPHIKALKRARIML